MYVWEKEITSNYHEVDVHFKTHSLSSNFTVFKFYSDQEIEKSNYKRRRRKRRYCHDQIRDVISCLT